MGLICAAHVICSLRAGKGINMMEGLRNLFALFATMEFCTRPMII